METPHGVRGFKSRRLCQSTKAADLAAFVVCHHNPVAMAEPHPQVIDPQHPLVIQLPKICMGYPEAVKVEAWGGPLSALE